MDADNGTSDDRDRGEQRPGMSRAAWRGCCLVPTVVAVLAITVALVAQLYARRSSVLPILSPESSVADSQRKTAMAEFIREFFRIATDADEANSRALMQLQMLARGRGKVETVRTAFHDASEPNAKAAAEYRKLQIPERLVSRAKLRRAISTVARSYDVRHETCGYMQRWNGDMNDQSSAREFKSRVEEINRLTAVALRTLREAANDNGMTMDDLRKVLTGGAIIIWPDLENAATEDSRRW